MFVALDWHALGVCENFALLWLTVQATRACKSGLGGGLLVGNWLQRWNEMACGQACFGLSGGGRVVKVLVRVPVAAACEKKGSRVFGVTWP